VPSDAGDRDVEICSHGPARAAVLQMIVRQFLGQPLTFGSGESGSDPNVGDYPAWVGSEA